MLQFIFYIILILHQLPDHAQVKDPETFVEEGAMIYHEGRSASGRDIRATHLKQNVSSTTIACVTCHGAQGQGGTDASGIIIPPLEWSAIKAKITTNLKSNKVDRITISRKLTKAISSGEGLNGAPLHVLMPRYNLTINEMNSLLVYLEKLGRIE